jgi:hypothetical protein
MHANYQLALAKETSCVVTPGSDRCGWIAKSSEKKSVAHQVECLLDRGYSKIRNQLQSTLYDLH